MSIARPRVPLQPVWEERIWNSFESVPDFIRDCVDMNLAIVEYGVSVYSLSPESLLLVYRRGSPLYWMVLPHPEQQP
jgi:hypothetical protein